MKILTTASLNALKKEVKEVAGRVEQYLSGSDLLENAKTIDVVLPNGKPEINYETIISAARQCKEELGSDFRGTHSEFGAKIADKIFSEFSDLPRNRAIDERLWAYLAHGPLKQIVQLRWPLEKMKDESNKKKIQYILNHYFIHDKREQCLVEQHGISSFWWIGKIVSSVKIHDKQTATKILLRPGILRNVRFHNYMRTPNTLDAILQIVKDVEMSKKYDNMHEKNFITKSRKGKSVERKWLDELSIYFHRTSGVRMLYALDTEMIINIMREKLGDMSRQDYVPEKSPAIG